MKTKTYDPRALFSSCFPLLAQKKEDQPLADSATAMKAILQEDNGLPKGVLNQAMCVLIFPSVKKVAIGIGAVTGAARSCAARVPR